MPQREMDRAAAGGRTLRQRLKRTKRKSESARWLRRQLADGYVQQAKAAGYRARAAFKLIQLDDRFHFLAPGRRVVDLGAAPGSWSQVCVERVRPDRSGGRVVALDKAAMAPLPQVRFLQIDLSAGDVVERLRALLDADADVVLSDIAAPTTGHRATDHLRTLALAAAAADVAGELLGDGGTAVIKLFQGADERDLYAHLAAAFERVQRVKPRASRSDSVELYLVAQGYRRSATAA